MGDLIESLKKDSQILKEQIAEICLYMGGGLDFNAAWGINYLDRELMVKVINRKIKRENPDAKEYM